MGPGKGAAATGASRELLPVWGVWSPSKAVQEGSSSPFHNMLPVPASGACCQGLQGSHACHFGVGKRQRREFGAGSPSISSNLALPSIVVHVGCIQVNALVDTGWNIFIVSYSLVRRVEMQLAPADTLLCMLNGSQTKCIGKGKLSACVRNIPLDVDCLALEDVVLGYDVILGMNALLQLGECKSRMQGCRLGEHMESRWLLGVLWVT